MSNCTGHGFDFDLMFWDTDREEADPRWPSTAAELQHGMRMPDMEPFYEQRAKRRHAELITAFEQSDERAALGDEPLRFLQPFFWMQYCCSGDPDDDFFAEDLARDYVRDVHRWADADEIDDYSAIVSELLAFWAFADRTALLPRAPRWHALLRAMAAGR